MGQFQPENLQRLEDCSSGLNHTLYQTPQVDCHTETSSAYGVLIIGQLLIGFGALPVYTLGVAYLDEIAGPATVHVFLGIMYAFSALGPAIGFLLGSVFLSMYVDIGVTEHPPEDDPNFVGRWWAGYVLCGSMAVATSIPLLMYPKQLPGTAWIMEEKRKKQKGTGRSSSVTHANDQNATDGDMASKGIVARFKHFAKELFVMVKTVVTLMATPVLVTNIMGSTAEAFAVAGLVPFLTKIFQTQFSVTASIASLLTGVCVIVGVVGGILFSSWLMKFRKVHGLRLAKYSAAIAFVAAFFIPGFLIHCTSPPIVGVTEQYANSSVTGDNRCNAYVNDTCFSACGCVSERYDPVCGSDGQTYPTPCLAGCRGFRNGTTSKADDRIYTECQCVAINLNNSLASATAEVGRCRNTNCKALVPFVFLLIAMMFVTFMNNVPAVEVVLQSVPASSRTMATGIQQLLIRCLGNTPGPVFYGFLLDKGCQLWQLTCCKEGNCFEYDNAYMSYAVFGATFGCKTISFVFFFLSWRFFIHA